VTSTTALSEERRTDRIVAVPEYAEYRAKIPIADVHAVPDIAARGPKMADATSVNDTDVGLEMAFAAVAVTEKVCDAIVAF